MNPRLLLAALFLTSASAAAPTWSGDPGKGAEELSEQWTKIEHPSPSIGIRGIFRFTVEAAGLDWYPERIEQALKLARSMQDLDPASKTYGNFKWRRDHPKVEDQNAVEFSVQQAAFLRLRYASILTAGGTHRLDELLSTAIEGMHRHKVPVAYTNIFVMKSWNLIATGEALSRPAVAEEGYRQFSDWLAYTAENGIAEYGAVTYYGVDLDSLALIARYADRAEGRTQAESALRYLWTDIAANWWAPGDRLGGANSRSYDYLYGRGYLEAHTWTAGWLRKKPELEGAGWLPGPRGNLTTLLDACTWVPPEELTAGIRAQVPRVVVQRWNAAPPIAHAIHYVGHHVSLASSGASHGSDDRTLVANLGDSPAVPQMVLFMDGRGDPYGTHKLENAANQAKSLHLTPFIATVQKGAEVLQVLSDEPMGPKSRRKHGELSVFYTQLTLPAQAEVWFGDRRERPGRPQAPKTVPTGKPVFVRLGDAVVAVKFLFTQATDGQPAPVLFIADQSGDPADRLTVVHSAGEPVGRGTTVVWLRAAENLDETGFAAFRRTFAEARGSAKVDGTNLKAVVAGLNAPLRIEANLATGIRRELAGSEPDALLSINGQDVGQELLGPYRTR